MEARRIFDLYKKGNKGCHLFSFPAERSWHPQCPAHRDKCQDTQLRDSTKKEAIFLQQSSAKHPPHQIRSCVRPLVHLKRETLHIYQCSTLIQSSLKSSTCIKAWLRYCRIAVVLRWPCTFSNRGTKQKKWRTHRGAATLPSAGSSAPDLHQTTAITALIRDVKGFFPALSLDYHW